MSYDAWRTRTPDDDPEGEHQPDLAHYPGGECECHCDRCGAVLELDPIDGQVYASCGDCYGGAEPDYEAAADMHARLTDPTHPSNVEARRLKR